MARDSGSGATAAEEDGAMMEAVEASSAEAPCLCKHEECGHAVTHSLSCRRCDLSITNELY